MEIVYSDHWNVEVRGPKRDEERRQECTKEWVDAEDAGPPLEVEVDSGTVDDAGKMRRATVRGEAPARTSHRVVFYIAHLRAAILRNSRWVENIFLEVTCVLYEDVSVYSNLKLIAHARMWFARVYECTGEIAA